MLVTVEEGMDVVTWRDPDLTQKDIRDLDAILDGEYPDDLAAIIEDGRRSNVAVLKANTEPVAEEKPRPAARGQKARTDDRTDKIEWGEVPIEELA